jgi:hypothetical protein
MSGIVNQPALADLSRPERKTSGSVNTAAIQNNAVTAAKLKDALLADFTEVVIATGDSLLLGDVGDSGNTKRDTVQGLIDLVATGLQANQAALEAETNENTYAPPDLIKHNPGVAKAWVKFDVAGTVNASYNMDSVTDTGTGDWSPQITTDFSSGDYTAVPGFREDAANGNQNHTLIGAQAAGSFQVTHNDSAGSLTDPAAADDMHAAAFGDQ